MSMEKRIQLFREDNGLGISNEQNKGPFKTDQANFDQQVDTTDTVGEMGDLGRSNKRNQSKSRSINDGNHDEYRQESHAKSHPRRSKM